jgi:hypothetical protein
MCDLHEIPIWVSCHNANPETRPEEEEEGLFFFFLGRGVSRGLQNEAGGFLCACRPWFSLRVYRPPIPMGPTRAKKTPKIHHQHFTKSCVCVPHILCEYSLHISGVHGWAVGSAPRAVMRPMNPPNMAPGLRRGAVGSTESGASPVGEVAGARAGALATT